jgi:hypothetical protein
MTTKYYRPVISINGVEIQASDNIEFIGGLRYRYVSALVIAAFFIGVWVGIYYNATRQMDVVLPKDNTVVRDLGYVAPVSDRLEVGML